MKRSITAAMTAAVLAISPMAATGAFAQMTDMSMIENQVTGDLAKIGVNDVDVSSLTLKQLQEISLVIASGDGVTQKQNLVKAIVERDPLSQAN